MGDIIQMRLDRRRSSSAGEAGTADEAEQTVRLISSVAVPNAADVVQVEENLKALKGRAPKGEHRIAMARNLGRLLQPLRRRRGGLGALMHQVGIALDKPYTKHLGRYVVFPDRSGDPASHELSADLGNFVKLARAGARTCHPKLVAGDAEALGVMALVDGIPGLEPVRDTDTPLDTAERDVAERLSGVVAMLMATADSVAAVHDLEGYFKAIADWNLVSGDAGASFYVDDHVFGAEPGIPEFWNKRSDLFPLIKLFTVNPDEPATVVVEVRKQDGDVQQCEMSHSHAVWFGIAPLGPGGRCCPVLAEIHTGVVNLRDNRSGSDVMRSDVVSILLGKQVDVCLVRQGEREPVSIRLLEGDGLDRRLHMDCVEPLTIRSAYRLFHRLPRSAVMAAIREEMDNPFQDATRAVPRSVAASIERNLLYCETNDPHRIDNQLDRAAKTLTEALRTCLDAIDTDLRERTQRVLDEQERRKRTGHASETHASDI